MNELNLNLDLGQMPCPARVLDGFEAPLNVDATSPVPGVVRLAITATAPVILGVRDAAPTDALVLPGGAPARRELDVRFVPVERVLVDMPAAFVAAHVRGAIDAALAAAEAPDA